MTTASLKEQTTTFKIGWWLLVLLSALSIINHASLLFFIPDEATLFLGWAAFNVFSTVVLLIPYRRLEKWAWNLTWVLVLPYVVIALFDSEIGIYYVSAGVLMALGQLLTRSAFNK